MRGIVDLKVNPTAQALCKSTGWMINNSTPKKQNDEIDPNAILANTAGRL